MNARTVIEVPFFPNSDNTHCYQAVIQMLALHLFGENHTQVDLEPITHKLPGKWTWPTSGLLWLHSKGAEVIVIEQFDYARFAAEGRDYLKEAYGEDVALAQEKNSDLSFEKELLSKVVREKSFEVTKDTPTISSIRSYIDDGYVVICNVNSRKLYGREGYSGHFVLVVGYDTTQNTIIFHDPSSVYPETDPRRLLAPEPTAYKEMPCGAFVDAWCWPNAEAASLIAVRKV